MHLHPQLTILFPWETHHLFQSLPILAHLQTHPKRYLTLQIFVVVLPENEKGRGLGFTWFPIPFITRLIKLHKCILTNPSIFSIWMLRLFFTIWRRFGWKDTYRYWKYVWFLKRNYENAQRGPSNYVLSIIEIKSLSAANELHRYGTKTLWNYSFVCSFEAYSVKTCIIIIQYSFLHS